MAEVFTWVAVALALLLILACYLEARARREDGQADKRRGVGDVEPDESTPHSQ